MGEGGRVFANFVLKICILPNPTARGLIVSLLAYLKADNIYMLLMLNANGINMDDVTIVVSVQLPTAF